MAADSAYLNPLRRPSRSIWGFLSVSVVMHALALLLWPLSPPTGGTPGGGVLHVRLATGSVSAGTASGEDKVVQSLAAARPPALAEQSPAADPPRTPKRELARPPAQPAALIENAAEPVEKELPAMGRTARFEPEKEPTEKIAPAPAAVQRMVGTAPAAASADAPALSPVGGERGGIGGDASLMVQAALRKAMLPYFDYPLLARRRGWEGRVRIALLVQPDGDLTDMHVLESSGYRVLDQAALEDLREVGRLPQATAWLDGKQMDVVLPVQYRFE